VCKEEAELLLIIIIIIISIFGVSQGKVREGYRNRIID